MAEEGSNTDVLEHLPERVPDGIPNWQEIVIFFILAPEQTAFFAVCSSKTSRPCVFSMPAKTRLRQSGKIRSPCLSFHYRQIARHRETDRPCPYGHRHSAKTRAAALFRPSIMKRQFFHYQGIQSTIPCRGFSFSQLSNPDLVRTPSRMTA